MHTSKKKHSILFKYASLFIIGFFVYMFIEIAFRGYTYLTMGLAGGIAFILIGLINEILPWSVYIEIQMCISSLIITAIELIFGSILFNFFNMRMWDYSDQPLNYHGYICLLFSIIWLFVGLVAIVLDDTIRYQEFNEEKPRYRSIIMNFIHKFNKKLMV